MAPTKAPVVRAATSHTKTPSLSSRSVVPAIPLAMMPKRTSKPTNLAKDNISATNADAAASLEAALIGHGSSASDETSPATPSVPNASSNGSGSGKVPGKTSNETTIHEASSNGIHVDGHANGTRAGGGTAKTAKSVAQPSTQESVSRIKPATTNKPRTNGEMVTKEPDQTRDYPSQAPSPETTPEGNSQPTLSAQNPNAEPIALTTFATSNTNHETPHFQPMHQSRLSNGVEIMFGGFPNSHTPSPAPMPFGAAAFGPPPQPSLNGSRMPYHHGPDHSQSNSVHSGLSAAVRADGLPAVAALEGYGQPHASTQARGDSFNHNPARHGPPTPMSYHGSHNSVDAINNVEMNGTFVPAPGMPHVATNQTLGFHPLAPPFPAFMPPNIYNDRSIVVEDQLMGSIDYFRAQFGNTELSDSIIELVYVDGRRPPVKLPGHRIIVCRSPTLKRHVMLAMRQSQSSAITIQTDDKFVRSDAWWMALQRLYLHPLLNLPPMAGSAKSADFAGDHGDRFEFCLGYAAAGHLLQLHDVLLRGLHMAADLVNWNTVETALEFVLHNTRQRHTDYSSEQDGSYQSFVDMEYGYGPDTRVLMDAIITFLIAAFPPQFELDANVSDPVSYARIPQLPGVPALVSPTESIPPAIARGTNSQHRSTPSRLGNIKFGDLPSSDTHNAQGPRTPPSSYFLILSRVLLNLPFDELRAVLSYGQSNNASWKSAQSRMRAIPSVIAGREARRLRTLELIRHGVSPNTRAVKERLSANRRHAIVEPWDVLNWVELVSFNENNEAVGLARNWQPTFSIGAQSSQPHVPKIAQSMV